MYRKKFRGVDKVGQKCFFCIGVDNFQHHFGIRMHHSEAPDIEK
jgi:hypothetical protein